MHRGKEPEIFKAEPYVFSEYVHGPDSNNYGQGEFSWMTGTASWMWKVCLEWIMGIRPEIRGLLIDPCIPRDWDAYKVTRRYRGATYEIEVTNPDHISQGVAEIRIDGKRHDSHLLPVFPAGETHRITVKMGETSPEMEAPAELVSQRISV
jgi:cellobiose phosphorylase